MERLKIQKSCVVCKKRGLEVNDYYSYKFLETTGEKLTKLLKKKGYKLGQVFYLCQRCEKSSDNRRKEIYLENKENYSKEWFSPQEINKLFHAPEISSKALLLMKTCYYGALRISEALNSKREDYRNEDYTYLLLRVQKTDKKNWEAQPIPPELYGDIDRFSNDNKIKSQDYVFQSNRSPKLSYPMAYKLIKKCTKIAGINKEITTHSFRRSRATHLLDDGLPLNKVSGFLRHKSLETTLKYLKLSKKRLFNDVDKIDKKNLFEMIK